MNDNIGKTVIRGNLLNLALAGVVCPRDATLCEIRADKNFITISIQSARDEKLITIHNSTGISDFCYWYAGRDIRKSLLLGHPYIDVTTGEIINIQKPLNKTVDLMRVGM